MRGHVRIVGRFLMLAAGMAAVWSLVTLPVRAGGALPDRAFPSTGGPVDGPPVDGNDGDNALPDLSPLPIAPPRAEIFWRVENPFRFFSDPADTDVHRVTYLELTPEERLTPVLSAERQLSRRHPLGWAETMVKKACWDAQRNSTACPGMDDPFTQPRGHKVLATLDGVRDANVSCTWLIEPLGDGDFERSALTQGCADPVRLDVPYPEGLKVSVEIGGSIVTFADIKVRDILIGGLGDSFGSGEGNPDVPVRFSRDRSVDYGTAAKYPEMAGYPARAGDWAQVGDAGFLKGNARWLDTACRRSLYGHQLRAALQLAVEDPHRAVTFVGLACSGAETTFGLFLRYKGNEWVPNPPQLSQISALAEAQCGENGAVDKDYPEAYHIKGVLQELEGGLVLRRCERKDSRPIDLLFVSIGGNDIGFARLIANAVLTDNSTLKWLGGWFGQVHGNAESRELLKAVDERYKALNRAFHGILHIPWHESDRVVLTAYPPLALMDATGRICPDGNAGMDVISTFGLSQKVAREGSKLADQLYSVMSNSAQSHGWSFADAHRAAFAGRGICAGSMINAVAMADDLRLARKRNGRWDPYNPADYEPYATRQRWFRTPNDAFMTGNFHATGSVLRKALDFDSLSWFQVLLASTYSGAFHPNAEGQAALADSVADKARIVLEKYDQTSRTAVLP